MHKFDSEININKQYTLPCDVNLIIDVFGEKSESVAVEDIQIADATIEYKGDTFDIIKPLFGSIRHTDGETIIQYNAIFTDKSGQEHRDMIIALIHINTGIAVMTSTMGFVKSVKLSGYLINKTALFNRNAKFPAIIVKTEIREATEGEYIILNYKEGNYVEPLIYKVTKTFNTGIGHETIECKTLDGSEMFTYDDYKVITEYFGNMKLNPFYKGV